MQFDAPTPIGSHGADRSTKIGPIAFRLPLALFVISLSMIAAVWCWLAIPAMPYAPIDTSKKLDCVSYAPFRAGQTPWNSSEVISPQQIAEDLATLSGISGCIRIYSVENGLDKVPELAAKAGLKVILGVWIGRDRLKNAGLIDTAVSLAKDHPDVITSMVVGREVLLRGEMTVSDLRQVIRSAKARVNVPVTYADVWEFWLRYREIGDDVDFVTVHVLPFWEDSPVRAEDAAAHVDDIRRQMTADLPGKPILIGEAGWPTRGRMRDGALPSRINQARFISELLDLARREDFRVNLFEAYDEPWKRQWEGTVGGHWGLLDGYSRELKYPPGSAVGNYPFWKLQLGIGSAFSTFVFATALLTLRRRPSKPGWAPWFAVAASATIGGILLGMSVEKTLYESYGVAGWFEHGLWSAMAIVAPLLCASAQMSGRPLPAFVELIGPREDRTRSLPMRILGFMLIVTTLVATMTALGLVFDPRWRDFPFASLTMAVVPVWTVGLLNHRRPGTGRIAEAAFAGLFASAAFYIAFNEGPRNWQSLWTSAAFVLLAAALWPPRLAFVASAMSQLPAAFARLPGNGGRAVQPVTVASVSPPRAQSASSLSLPHRLHQEVECDR
jgi:exo-beta-1,3-glucanase (GH17 family)